MKCEMNEMKYSMVERGIKPGEWKNEEVKMGEVKDKEEGEKNIG